MSYNNIQLLFYKMKQNMFFDNKKSSKRSRLKMFIAAIIILLAVLFLFRLYGNGKKGNFKQFKTEEKMKLELENMPSWNLSDLYPSIDSKELKDDIARSEKRAVNFAKKYNGKINDLEANQLYLCIKEYEEITELIGKLGSYASLKYAEDLSVDENVKFYQKISELSSKLYSQIVFFQLELNEIPESKLKGFYETSEKLKYYKPFIDDSRVFKPHQLSEQLEKLMIEKSVSGRNAWSRLFDETIDNMVFEFRGKELNQSEILEIMSGKDEKARKEASKIFGETLGKHGKTFAYITNTLAKDKEIDDRWGKFQKPISSRNLSNLIEDNVVEALRKTVKDNYKNTSHRYYKLKAEILGKEKLHYSDRNAPMPFDNDRIYQYEDAMKIVKSAYQNFSPTMAEIGQKFFDNNWIDVPTRQGKRGGAFSASTVPSVHPYILLNYQGKTRDVMTLAHELGHGIHQYLSQPNGYLMADAPLTLSETASIFGEQLTFRQFLREETDPEKKKAILANKIEDMLNSVNRQIAFLEFETAVHNERKNGEIPLERLNEIWLQTQKESLGEDNFIFDDEYKNYWMYIPHFIHSPFYVYSYAFGDCLVNTLYSKYIENPNGFEEKYLELLKNGNSVRYNVALRSFGLNPGDPKFWQGGINVIVELIDEFEELVKY